MIGCDGKIVFSTYAGARKAARKMRRKKEEAVEEYKCRECRWYHVGHPSTESLQKRHQRKEVADYELDPDVDLYGPETQGEAYDEQRIG